MVFTEISSLYRIFKESEKMKNRLKFFIDMVLLVALLFLISGCMSSTIMSKNNSTAAANQVTEHDTIVKKKPTAVYYDFDDILIPKELKIVNNSTVLVSTPGYTSGIMTLRGRVEKRSLTAFFVNNMEKDNWNRVSQIKSPASTIMIFRKPAKWAVITIRDKDFYTYVEIGVSPTIDNNANESSTSEKNIFN